MKGRFSIKITTFAAIVIETMRKSITYISALAITLMVNSCSDKLNIQAPYKNITVVYGLLDQNETAHYIRVNRAYEGVGNALQIAQQFDSVYYPANQISVYLQDYNSNGNLVDTINLVPDSSITLPPGIFPTKQILYRTNRALNVNDTYNLVVINKKTGLQLSGSTTLLPDVVFGNGVVSGTVYNFSFSNIAPSQIAWTSSVGGSIYQMTFRFYYSETTASTTTHKYIDWVFATQTAPTTEGGYPMLYDVTGDEFLDIVHSLIPFDPSVTSRTADSLSLQFTSGSYDLNTYIQLSQPSLGIDQDPPAFSDVKNGYGIYTSRHMQIITKPLASAMLDSLHFSDRTSNLLFQP